MLPSVGKPFCFCYLNGASVKSRWLEPCLPAHGSTSCSPQDKRTTLEGACTQQDNGWSDGRRDTRTKRDTERTLRRTSVSSQTKGDVDSCSARMLVNKVAVIKVLRHAPHDRYVSPSKKDPVGIKNTCNQNLGVVWAAVLLSTEQTHELHCHRLPETRKAS